MKTASGIMPQNVVKFVRAGTWMINLVLLLCHIGYGILFWIYDAPVLFAYNCLSNVALAFAVL